MIAFDRAGDAAEWCLLLQEVMMEVRRGGRRGEGGWRKVQGAVLRGGDEGLLPEAK